MLKRRRRTAPLRVSSTSRDGGQRTEKPHVNGLVYACLVSLMMLVSNPYSLLAHSDSTSNPGPLASRIPRPAFSGIAGQAGAGQQPAATFGQRPTASNPIPLLAYYYIWFDVNSWDRAKTDFPLLGRYSSDDVPVMRQHIRWAKAAGITGFVVSWKNTAKLDRRLAQLVQLAEAEDFKLCLIYQGLDFERDPLPIQQVADDLDYFIQQYSHQPAFDLFEKPVVILSGTWEYSIEEIASLTQGRRDYLLILASEKNVKGYERLAHLVDGDAYYWSSVNPDTFPNYPGKLIGMGEAIHTHAGLWIAPAAPGFDARLVGGTKVVERKDGETLRRELETALQSTPDAIGLISWNEFSENSQLEPSENYGQRYLEVLTDVQHRTLPPLSPLLDFDSSDPGDTQLGVGLDRGRTLAVSILIALVLSSLIVIGQRRFIQNR